MKHNDTGVTYNRIILVMMHLIQPSTDGNSNSKNLCDNIYDQQSS